MNKEHYSIGFQIGLSLKQSGVSSLDMATFSQGVSDALAEAKSAFSIPEMEEALHLFFEKQQQEKQKSIVEFFDANGKREGVVTTASGLQYEILTPAIGQKPRATDKVKVHYEGSLVDGTIFDSSYKRGEPIVFALNEVIAGWTEGLQLMAIGAKYKFYIPYHLGYGEQGIQGSIPPFATLIFVVELLDIMK